MIGQVLKQFRIEELVGQGGMGVVYRAHDTRLARSVAIKVLKPEIMQDAERCRRFVQEARSASAVSHPAVAQVYDVDTVNGVTFIVMELIEGRTVRRLLADAELDLLASLDIAIQVADGLAKAHDAGVVHRDIKSDNIKVTPDGHAKILDFGLAKLDPLRGERNSDDLSQLETLAKTQAGAIMGTVAYMSPEQARGKPVDQRSDIFSLGVMIYEMAAGKPPFVRESAIDTLHAIAFEPSPPLTEVRPGLPPILRRIVARCLEKDPERRYSNARELAADLRALRRDVESGISRPVPLWERLSDGVEALKRVKLSRAAIVAAIVVLPLLLFAMRRESFWTLLLFIPIGLAVYRRIKNRRLRLVRRIATKLKKVPEVRLISFDGRQMLVIAEPAQARLYLRLNELIDSANRRMIVGEPLVASVRDDVGPEELQTLLRQPGIVFVRDEIVETVRR